RQRLPHRAVSRYRHPSGRFQDGMRPPVRERDDANHRRRRDLARFVPAMGHQVEREARQGPLPQGSRRPVGGLYRSRQAAGDFDGERTARRLGSGTGEGLRFAVKARVTVTLKSGILDPQGKAIEGGLKSLGVDGVASVRQGKVFDIELSGSDKAKAEAALKDAADKLLANTVI